MRNFGFAYVANNPLNATDPTGENTRVRVRAYRLRGAAGALGKGHAFVQYDDTETNQSRVSRGGPSGNWPGGLGDALADRAFDGVNVLAQDDPTAGSIDTLEPAGRGIEVVDVFDVELTSDFSEVQEALASFNEAVNGADSPYRPQSNNSNTYAGDAFEALTGLEVQNNTDVDLPGFEEDLDNVDPTDPLVERH